MYTVFLQDSGGSECVSIPLAVLARLHDRIGADPLEALLLHDSGASEPGHVVATHALSAIWSSAAEAFLTSSESVSFNAIPLRLFLHHISNICALEAAADIPLVVGLEEV